MKTNITLKRSIGIGSTISDVLQVDDLEDLKNQLESRNIKRVALKYLDMIDDGPNWEARLQNPVNVSELTEEHYKWIIYKSKYSFNYIEIY